MTTKPAICIVEDEAGFSIGLKVLFARNGFRVTGAAGNSKDAVELILADPPDIILLDVNIAGDMDGVEVARRVRERISCPIIFLTAYSNLEMRRRVAEIANAHYAEKPLQDADILAAVANRLAGLAE